MNRRFILTLINCCLLAAATGTLIIVQARNLALDEMAPVVSKVDNLAILGQRMEWIGRHGLMVLELSNETDKSIVTIEVEARDGKNVGGYSEISHIDDKPYIATPRESFQLSSIRRLLS